MAVEAGGQIVLLKYVLVIWEPREIVVRRLRGADMARTEPERVSPAGRSMVEMAVRRVPPLRLAQTRELSGSPPKTLGRDS